MSPLLETLRGIVGAAHVLTPDQHDLSGWTQDWRKRAQGCALAVVRPANTHEVAAVVRHCAAARVALVPQGGNTGLVGGSIPDASGTQVLLSLSRLKALRGLDAANLTLTVEAGCTLQAVQDAARAAGLLFPLSMGSQGSCSIGGNLATNAGGTQVLRYGNARALCLGLELVTPGGDIWHGLHGLRKDNTGYDLRDLFIGSEGTLGVITAATLKLHPLPAATLTAWVAAPSLDATLTLLALARAQLGDGLTGFEVMGEVAIDLLRKHFPGQRLPLAGRSPWCVLLENSDGESEAHARGRFEVLLERALADGCASDAALAGNLAQSQAMWHLREAIPLAQAAEGLNIKHDIALPISAIPAYVRETDAALAAALPGCRIVNYGHLGDGNLHYNMQAPEGLEPRAWHDAHEALANRIVYDGVLRHQGSISAEHGIGAVKAHELPHYKDATALALMRAIKRALDPHNQMNPGRVLDAR